MVKTIKPHGAIREDLIVAICNQRKDVYFLIDDCGNRWGIEASTFINLKDKGYKEVNYNEIRKSDY